MQLDPRKEALLGAIIQTYVERAEPVGSELLAAALDLGVRSATIRNELAEMTERGYLLQPHVSAGRVPSTLGYRYYVDRLMVHQRVASSDQRRLRGVHRVNQGDIEQLLIQTCRVLSSLTGYLSMAVPPAGACERIRSAHLAQTGPSQVLLVVVLDSGRVLHRFVQVPGRSTPAQVTRLSNELDQIVGGASVDTVTAPGTWPDEMAGDEDVLRTLIQAVATGVSPQATEPYLEGTSTIFGQPEFREPDRVEPLIRLLEERRTLYEHVRQLLSGSEAAVSIGEENPHASMQECSVVLAHYRAGASMSGWIGVLGPTRMRYHCAVPAVRFAARALSDVFAAISLA